MEDENRTLFRMFGSHCELDIAPLHRSLGTERSVEGRDGRVAKRNLATLSGDQDRFSVQWGNPSEGQIGGPGRSGNNAANLRRATCARWHVCPMRITARDLGAACVSFASTVIARVAGARLADPGPHMPQVEEEDQRSLDRETGPRLKRSETEASGPVLADRAFLHAASPLAPKEGIRQGRDIADRWSGAPQKGVRVRPRGRQGHVE